MPPWLTHCLGGGGGHSTAGGMGSCGGAGGGAGRAEGAGCSGELHWQGGAWEFWSGSLVGAGSFGVLRRQEGGEEFWMGRGMPWWSVPDSTIPERFSSVHTPLGHFTPWTNHPKVKKASILFALWTIQSLVLRLRLLFLPKKTSKIS